MLDVLSLDYFDDAGYLEFLAVNGNKFKPDDIFFRLDKDEFDVTFRIEGYPFLAVRQFGLRNSNYYQVFGRDKAHVEIHNGDGIPLIFSSFKFIQEIFSKPTCLEPHRHNQQRYVLTNY